MPCRTAASVSNPVLCGPVRQGGLTATFDDSSIEASVNFEIDSDRRVLAINASDCPRAFAKQLVETPWSGIFADYKDFNGIRVPTRAEVD